MEGQKLRSYNLYHGVLTNGSYAARMITVAELGARDFGVSVSRMN